jgi:hypothetical protein
MGLMDIFVWLVEWYVFIISIYLLYAYLQYHNFFFIRRHKVGWHQAILKHTFEATTAQILHSQICFAVTMPRRLWLVK